MATLQEILQSKIGKGGVSKTYVANLLGVGEKTIENYMRGLRQPKPKALVQLSKALDFDLSVLQEQSVPYGNKGAQNALKQSPTDYKDKYYKKLEEENERLKKELEINSISLDRKVETLAELQFAIVEILLAMAADGGKKSVYNKTVDILKKRKLEGSLL